MESRKGGNQEVIFVVIFLLAVLIASAFLASFNSVVGGL